MTFEQLAKELGWATDAEYPDRAASVDRVRKQVGAAREKYPTLTAPQKRKKVD